MRQCYFIKVNYHHMADRECIFLTNLNLRLAPQVILFSVPNVKPKLLRDLSVFFGELGVLKISIHKFLDPYDVGFCV